MTSRKEETAFLDTTTLKYADVFPKAIWLRAQENKTVKFIYRGVWMTCDKDDVNPRNLEDKYLKLLSVASRRCYHPIMAVRELEQLQDWFRWSISNLGYGEYPSSLLKEQSARVSTLMRHVAGKRNVSAAVDFDSMKTLKSPKLAISTAVNALERFLYEIKDSFKKVLFMTTSDDEDESKYPLRHIFEELVLLANAYQVVMVINLRGSRLKVKPGDTVTDVYNQARDTPSSKDEDIRFTVLPPTVG